MPNYSDFGAVGSVILKKTANSGGGAFTLNSQITIPVAMVQPVNPKNIQYPSVAQTSDSLSVAVTGNKTPAVNIRTYVKPSWLTASLLNSLIITTDSTTKLTDEFAIQIKHQYVTRVFSLAKCASVVFTQTAQGGPVIVDMTFVAIYGTDYSGADENPSPATFTAAVIDPGQLTSKAQVKYNSTADQVKGHTLALSRVQSYQFSDNGTLYAEAISSGAFGGSLALGQSPTATTLPSSTVTVQYGATSAGIQAVCALNLDSEVTNFDPGLGVMTRSYTLANLSTGLIPAVVTAL